MQLVSDITRIQQERAEWAARNFPNAGAKEHTLGVCEEAGELAHAILKLDPGTAGGESIRGSSDTHLEEAADALGDIFVYSCGVATDLGLSLADCINAAWDGVKKRDWVNNPQDGVHVEQPSDRERAAHSELPTYDRVLKTPAREGALQIPPHDHRRNEHGRCDTRCPAYRL